MEITMSWFYLLAGGGKNLKNSEKLSQTIKINIFVSRSGTIQSEERRSTLIWPPCPRLCPSPCSWPSGIRLHLRQDRPPGQLQVGRQTQGRSPVWKIGRKL